MALGENETTKVRVCHRWVIPGCLDLQIIESHHISGLVVEEEDRRKPLIEYLEHGRLLEDPRGIFLRCLDKEEAQQTMEEAHSSTCGAHQSRPKLHFCIKMMDFFEHAKKCQACQFHANYIHQFPEDLHPTVASWPFDA
ncbi:hypothetical protein KY285_007765 [Solanum tuberosum]|nr:hypothetical protein KY285_007765 [Solanum tuberosum]